MVVYEGSSEDLSCSLCFDEKVYALCAPFLKTVDVIHVARCGRLFRRYMVRHLLSKLFQGRIFGIGDAVEKKGYTYSQMSYPYWCHVQEVVVWDIDSGGHLPPCIQWLIWRVPHPPFPSSSSSPFLTSLRKQPLFLPSTLNRLRVNNATILNYVLVLPPSVQLLEWNSSFLPYASWFAQNRLRELRMDLLDADWTQAHFELFPHLQELHMNLEDVWGLDLSVLSSLIHLHLHSPENHHHPFLSQTNSCPKGLCLPASLCYLCLCCLDCLDWEHPWPIGLRFLRCESLSLDQARRLDDKLDALICGCFCQAPQQGHFCRDSPPNNIGPAVWQRGSFHHTHEYIPRGVAHLYTKDEVLNLSSMRGLQSFSNVFLPHCSKYFDLISPENKKTFEVQYPIPLPDLPYGTLKVLFGKRKSVPPLPNTVTHLTLHKLPFLPALDLPRLQHLTLIKLTQPCFSAPERSFSRTLRTLTIHQSSRQAVDVARCTYACSFLQELHVTEWKHSIGSLEHLSHLRRLSLKYHTDIKNLSFPVLPENLQVLVYDGPQMDSRQLPPKLRKLQLSERTRFHWNTSLPSTLNKLALHLGLLEMSLSQEGFVFPLETDSFPFVTDLQLLSLKKANLFMFPFLHTLRMICGNEEHVPTPDESRECLRNELLADMITFPHKSPLERMENIPSTLQRVVFYDCDWTKRMIYLCD